MVIKSKDDGIIPLG